MSLVSILDEVRNVTKALSSIPARGRTKLTGAIAIEVIRSRLLEVGVPVSSRDVFIAGDATEFDLLVVRKEANPIYGIVYDPADVAAIVEIKFSGIYSQEGATNLRELFDRIRAKHPHIACVYLTICERRNYQHRISSESLGSQAFTLNWWRNYKREEVDEEDSWVSVVSCLRTAADRWV